MKDNQKDRSIDKSFFKAMNYEFAGEIGVIDNEDMKNNRKLNDDNKQNKEDNKK